VPLGVKDLENVEGLVTSEGGKWGLITGSTVSALFESPAALATAALSES
jgi:hypothetical protein